MNPYQISSPRKAFAAASIAMAAITLGLSVVVPAKMAPHNPDVRMVARIVVVAKPMPVDVVGIPEAELAAAQVRTTLRKSKREG